MPFNVFISYSTKDLPIVEHLRKLLTTSEVGVFVAKYSVKPGEDLNDKIVRAIKKCDLFVLLWSRKSKSSQYVLNEIGVARGNDKNILPIILDKRTKLPEFIKELKYLEAYRDVEDSFTRLQQYIFKKATHKNIVALLLLIIVGVTLWVSSKR